MDLEPVAGVGPTPEGEGVMSEVEQVEEETQDLVVQDPGEVELEVDLLEEILLALLNLMSTAGAGAHQGLQEGESPQEVGAEVRLEVPRSVSGAATEVEVQAQVEVVAGQADIAAETYMSPLLTSVENIWKLRIS